MTSECEREPFHESDDEIILKYTRILEPHGITDKIFKVAVNAPELQEGMASQQSYVTVSFENPEVEKLNLFVKGHTSNPSHNAMINALKAFEKEARFFTEYIPTAKELCNSKGHAEVLDIYPKCYYGDNNMIVLENLVLNKGYTLVNKEELQTLEEATFAVRALAKHHAISHAMIQSCGGANKFFERFPNLDYGSWDKPTSRIMMEPLMENGLKTSIQLLTDHLVEGRGRDDALNLLQSYVGKSYDVLLEMLEFNPDEERLLVLNHGDYWNNNMMFLKNQTSGTVIGHKMVDLQVTLYNSPVVDLSYYFYSTVKREVRRAHLRDFDLLDEYLQVLNQLASDLGYPIDLTSEEMFLMFRQKFLYGYIFGLCVACGPCSNVMKYLDLTNIGMSEFGECMDQLIQQWLKDNPDKAEGMAEEVVKTANEFHQLTLC